MPVLFLEDHRMRFRELMSTLLVAIALVGLFTFASSADERSAGSPPAARS
jgi:hypothetical protein